MIKKIRNPNPSAGSGSRPERSRGTKFEIRNKKILIINVNWIGDVLFSTPFIRAVREAYPTSYIACLLHPRCVEMLESNPRINEIILYDEEGRHRGLFGKAALIFNLRKDRFDTAFILHRSFTKALIARLAGIKGRIGYPTKNRSGLLTLTVEEPAEELHKVEYFLNVARSAGLKPEYNEYEFFVNDEDRAFAGKFLTGHDISDQDRVVAICPGGNWEPKRWPRENFARLADMITERFGAQIVICGAAKDALLAAEIASMMRAKPVIACGSTTLRQLGAIFERSALVAANDTGPMHIASAVGKDLIALFGPTSPGITGPHGKARAVVLRGESGCEVPCYDHACRDYRCMAAITVDEVFRAAEKIIATRNQSTETRQ